MSLRQKIILVVLGVFGAVAVSEVFVHRTHVLNAFARIEQEHAEEDLRRCTEAIQAEIDSLHDYNYSWSAWDDTYEYLQDHNPHYEESNLLDAAFEPANIGLYYFYDQAGRLVWGKAYAPDFKTVIKLGILPDALPGDHPFRALTEPETEVIGVVEDSGLLWELSAQPVITSEQTGPVMGVLVMARHLDDDDIGALIEQTRIDFSVAATSAPLADAGTGPDPQDPGTLIGRVPLEGLFGQQFVVTARLPRDIMAQGNAVLANSLARLGLLCIILATALLLFFEHSVILRLRCMRDFFARVASSGGLAERMPVRGRDELCSLAAEINLMFDELQAKSGLLAEALEQAQAADKAKSQFLAMVSHEIRTPLNGVLGMLSVLIDSGLSSDQRDYAHTARQSAEALLSLLNDVLDFSKLEAGKLDMEAIEFDLRSVVEDAVRVMAVRALEKRLDLNCSTSGSIPERLVGDPNRLRQVLMNLLSNAIKFTAEGEVYLSVELEAQKGDRVRLRFKVRDTGIGIAREQQSRLFQAFTQADASTTRRFGGTGLGLAISREIVSLLHGEIGLDSEEGQGATFWFTAEFGVARAQAAGEPAGRTSLAGKRLIIVDDNPTNRMVFDLQLSDKGMALCEADGGEAALRELRAAAAEGQPYDLALLDLHMPDIDGLELAQRIKADPGIAGVKLVLVTSYGQRGDAVRAMSRGIDAYLTKPVSEQTLVNCLETVASGVAPAAGPDAAPSALVTVHSLREAQRGLRLLVAEDNPINQKVALAILRKLGLGADIANNGREALEAVQSRHYDAVLMDWHMPLMDGLEATRAIRALEGSPSNIPIIALTASVYEQDRKDCEEAGMNAFVSKPLRQDELSAAIQRCCGVPEWGLASEDGAGPPADGAARDFAEPPVNLADGLERHGSREFWLELAQVYLDDSLLRLESLRLALQAGDLATLGNEAHAMKGSAGEMCAMPLRQACLELEQAARRGEAGRAGGLVAALETEYAKVQAVLEEQLASAKSVSLA